MITKPLLLILFSYVALSMCGSNGIDEDPNLELLQVNMVWRHGARSPDSTFPSDPNINYEWNQKGNAQLTQKGMSMQYNLGQFFRKRYEGFLNADYARQEIYVRSSDVERTLMSAECNMAGLYPPSGDQIWNDKLLWQPVPVHTIPLDQDSLIYFPAVHTYLYQKLYHQMMQTDQYKQMEEQSKEFMAELTTLTQSTKPLHISDAYSIYDPLKAAEVEGLPMPEWYNEERHKSLFTVASYWFGALFGYKTEMEIPLLKVGPGKLMEEIIDNFEDNIVNNIYKAIAYSGHDTTVTGILVALDQYAGLPPFAASVFFELYKVKSEEKYIVKTLYRTSPTEEPKALKVRGCDVNCPLEKFKSLFTSIFPDS